MGFEETFSSYLFTRPSFLEGISRTLDLGGTFDAYNESQNGKQADQRALARDWAMIGQDIQTATKEYSHESRASSV